MSLPQDKGSFTYADYLSWPQHERWEIIDGTAYMQEAPSPVHQEVLAGLLAQFFQNLSGKACKVYPAPFSVRLMDKDERCDEEIEKVVEPDITVVRDRSKIDQKGCLGAPDLIVEIVSPSSMEMDKLVKFNKYEKAGVNEYWIVEPENKLVSVFVLQGQKYGRPEIYAEEDKIRLSIFPDLSIDLKPVFMDIEVKGR